MLSWFQRCLFFLSFLPLWVSIAFVDFMSICETRKCLGIEIISLVLIIGGILISSLVVAVQMQKSKQGSHIHAKIVKVSKQKAVTAEYLLSYILPLFAFDFTKWKQVVLFLIFFATLAFLCLKHHYVYANIVLELWGYTCYDCTLKKEDENEFEAVVISADELTGMINHDINYTRMNGGYVLHLKPSKP